MLYSFVRFDLYLMNVNRLLPRLVTALLGACVCAAVLACILLPANRWVRVYDPRDEWVEIVIAAGLTGVAALRWFAAAPWPFARRNIWIGLDRALSAILALPAAAGAWVLWVNRAPTGVLRGNPLGTLLWATALVASVGWSFRAFGWPPTRSLAAVSWCIALGWFVLIVVASVLPAFHNGILMSSQGYCALVGACGATLAAVSANGVKREA